VILILSKSGEKEKKGDPPLQRGGGREKSENLCRRPNAEKRDLTERVKKKSRIHEKGGEEDLSTNGIILKERE